MYYNKGYLQIIPAIIMSIMTIIGIVIGGYIGSKKLIDDKILFRLYTIIIFILL
jgi:uncharacterized membrane protein YfcA